MIKLIITVLSTSMDSFNVGLSFGIRKIHITKEKILEISIFIALISFGAMHLGSLLTNMIPTWFCKIVGAFIFFLFAILSSKEILEKKQKKNLVSKFTHPETYDLNNDQQISFKEAMLMSISLALDTLIISMTLATESYSPFLTGCLFGGFNYLLLYFGTLCSNLKSIKRFDEKLQFLPPILFIILAIIRLI